MVSTPPPPLSPMSLHNAVSKRCLLQPDQVKLCTEGACWSTVFHNDPTVQRWAHESATELCSSHRKTMWLFSLCNHLPQKVHNGGWIFKTKIDTHTHSCIWLNPIAATACKISRQKSAHIRPQTEKKSVLHLNLPSILCILMEILWHTITNAKEKRKGLRNFKFSTFIVRFQVTSWHWNSERVKSWLMTDCGQLFALWLVSGERHLTLQWTPLTIVKKTEKKDQPYSMPLPVPHIPPHANTKVNLLLDPSE